MANDKIVKVNLSEKGAVDKAIDELKKFQQDMISKCVELLNELTFMAIEKADLSFSTAIYAGTNDVEISWEDIEKDKSRMIVAQGNATLFIEFGTGIRYENPYQAEYGFKAGGYGYGLGASEYGWLYQGDEGSNPPSDTEKVGSTNWVHTYGNPENKSMYNTITYLQQKAEETVRRIFNA